jgi:cytochrome c biogenesis protein CcdA
MGTILLGMLAGALTTLSPCVLPVLPFVLFAALDQHRLGPLALAAGMVATFTAVGLLVSGAGSVVDISGDAVRYVAATMMGLLGAILLSTALQRRLALAGAPVADFFNRSVQRFNPAGLGGQFALGALLGAVWSPCSGPTLGAAITLAAGSGTFAKAGLVMASFGVGASLPLMAIAYGSRRTLKTRRQALQNLGRIAKPLFGAVLLMVALLVLSGLDKAIEAAFVQSMPDWLVTLTTRY